MKRYSSAPCLADVDGDRKRIKSAEPRSEPNSKEYLELALKRVLELQREIKEGTYVSSVENSSDLEDSPNSEDLTKEILWKVFQDLPGTPSCAGTIIERAILPRDLEADAIRSKRIQLLGYDACRRMAVEFMKSASKELRAGASVAARIDPNYSSYRIGSYSRNEPRIAHRRTGLLLKNSRRTEGVDSFYDNEIRERMLRSLDLHLATKQRDYTAKLMRSGLPP